MSINPMITLHSTRLPLLNQRFEYDHYRKILRDPTFRAQFTDPNARDFECGKFVWQGIQEGATVLLQRISLSFEARIPVAVSLELTCRGKITQKIIEGLEDPFSLKVKGSAGTAERYYNLVPALIEPKLALKIADPALWELVRTFYRDIRNPIFHGHYLTNLNAEKLDEIFATFDEVTTWLDSLCDIKKRMNEIRSGKYNLPGMKPKNASVK